MENLELPIMQGQADRGRRSVAGFTVAFAASVLLHAALFIVWPGSVKPLSEPAPEPFELTLVSLPPRAADEQSAPETSPAPVASLAEAVEAQPAAEATAARSKAPVVEAVEEPEPQVVVPEPLDLTLPPGWVAEQEALQGSSEDLLPFNPELSKALAQARERQARSALLAARAGALTGLDTADFGTRRDALGETVKVDDACFALRQDALDAGAPRWWRVRCGDGRENAFLRRAPESDAVGRIVAD